MGATCFWSRQAVKFGHNWHTIENWSIANFLRKYCRNTALILFIIFYQTIRCQRGGETITVHFNYATAGNNTIGKKITLWNSKAGVFFEIDSIAAMRREQARCRCWAFANKRFGNFRIQATTLIKWIPNCKN